MIAGGRMVARDGPPVDLAVVGYDDARERGPSERDEDGEGGHHVGVAQVTADADHVVPPRATGLAQPSLSRNLSRPAPQSKLPDVLPRHRYSASPAASRASLRSR